MSDNTIEKLLDRFAQREKLALARLITLVENRGPDAARVMEAVYARGGHAHVVGITGPPGAGKSTIVNRLIARYRQANKRVGVLAIDPSSPFSGGAVLGDRVRMTEHYQDPGVYIRSLSTRGSHGGLSRAAREITRLLDAFGNDVILIETVGVGQTELSVMDLADTTVVVTVPEGGDGVQVMKAGLNEIADLFVVNKADRDGADRIKAELELSVHLRAGEGWRPPVLMTKASSGEGIDALLDAIDRHAAWLRDHRDPAREGERRAREFVEVLTAELGDRVRRGLSDGLADGAARDVREGRLNPYSAARELIGNRAKILDLIGDTEKPASDKRGA